MHWLPIGGWRWPGLIKYCLFSILFSVFLSGCSSEARETFSQQQLQQAVVAGFPAPRICNVDLLPMVMVQIYLEAPQLFIRKDGEPLMVQIDGQVDADVFGSLVTEKLPVHISGQARLRYDAGDHAIYLDRIDFVEARIDLEIALFKTRVVERFQAVLSQELASIPLIMLDRVPELSERVKSLARQSASGGVILDVVQGVIVISPDK